MKGDDDQQVAARAGPVEPEAAGARLGHEEPGWIAECLDELAAAVAIVLALLISFISLRVKAIFFAMVTLAAPVQSRSIRIPEDSPQSLTNEIFVITHGFTLENSVTFVTKHLQRKIQYNFQETLT